MQYQINGLIIPPDYSSGILVLQGEITSIDASIDAIDVINITSL
jgi:hypothetical protein